jgi:hypothetical protein
MFHSTRPQSLAELPRESIEKLNRLIVTVDQWPKVEARLFIDDSSSQDEIKKKALALALTLKHFANPLGGYPIDEEAHEAFKNILTCLDEPTKLGQNLQLTLDERKYLIDLLRLKLDKLADEIIVEHNLQATDIQKAILDSANKTPTSTPTLESEQKETPENQWWNNRSLEEQEDIRYRYRMLTESQRDHLNQRIFYSYSCSYDSNSYSYYQMCLIDAELNYLAFRTVIDLSAITAHGFLRGASILPYPGGVLGLGRPSIHHGLSLGDSKTDKEVLAIIAFIAFALSAIIGALYSTKKAFNSIRNIFTGEKIVRSLYRLTATAGSAYLGVLAGGALGALLGSALPGIGTAIGAILGMAFGAAAGAGLGALVAKYSAKLFSSILYRNELNPTNPDKWRLSEKRMEKMQNKGINIDAVIQEISLIKQEKKKLGTEASFFWTDARKEKNRLNAVLKVVKNIDKQYPQQYRFFHPPVPSAPPIELDNDYSSSTYKQ